MSRTSHLTSVNPTALVRKQSLKKSPNKFNVMSVMDMVILKLNVGPTSRNKRGALLLLGLMEVKQKKLQIM